MERKELSDHLFDEHGIMLTRQQYRNSTLEDLRALDPCSDVVDGVRRGSRLSLNPEPLKVIDKACRVCGKRAPWCSCGAMDYR